MQRLHRLSYLLTGGVRPHTHNIIYYATKFCAALRYIQPTHPDRLPRHNILWSPLQLHQVLIHIWWLSKWNTSRPVIKVQSTPTALDVWLSSSSPDQVERRWIWFIMDLSVYYLQQPLWRSSCGKVIRSMRRTKLKVETEETVDGTLKLNKQHVNQAHPRQVHEFGMQSSARGGSGGENSTPDQEGRQTHLIFNSPGSSRLHPNLSGNY